MIAARLSVFVFVAVAVLSVVPFSVSAQLDLSLSGPGAFQPEFTFSPITPVPGQEVTVEIGNFVSSLQGSSITWYKDGELLTTFTNSPSAKFTADAVGDPNNIEARLQTPSGQPVTVRGAVTAQYVDIILEPQTHVPDFFTGRALPSSGSQVNATVLINGQPSTNHIYSWRINNELLTGASLRGQYRTSFTMPQDSRVFLSLEVTNLDGSLFASKSVLVPNTRPFVHFYEVNTLYGVSQNTYDTLVMSGDSATLRAVPFYLDKRVYNQAEVISWEVDGRVVGNGNNPYEVTLTKNFASGRSLVDFRVQSTTALLQGARKAIEVFY